LLEEPGWWGIARHRSLENIKAAIKHMEGSEGSRLIGMEYLYLMTWDPIHLPECVIGNLAV
jgi:hypothetical protein